MSNTKSPLLIASFFTDFIYFVSLFLPWCVSLEVYQFCLIKELAFHLIFWSFHLFLSLYFNYFFSKLIIFLLWSSGFVCTFYSHSSRDKGGLFIWDCFVCLFSSGRPIFPYTSLLELLLFCLIGFGALCFHCQLSWDCFLNFIFDFFKEPFVV